MNQSMLLITIISCLINVHITLGQFYQGDYRQNNYGPPRQQQQQQFNPFNQNNIDNNVEQKYVNSGQSIMLVCDLPNSMPDGKVLFVKYDSKVLSSGLNIIDEIDDDRFEIGQQYAWEWSLKINSINEDDAGIYFCKVGYTTIKKYEIVVRVPPRIRDNGSGFVKSVKEGDGVQLSCFASGTPTPNITWFTISPEGDSLIPLAQTGSFLNIDAVSRATPRRYQCRASNYIPPSDTRNFTLSIEFAPEITIDSKLNSADSSMELNCTIRAYPLTNRNFWRKDGAFLQDSIKTNIKNIRVDDFTLVSQLTIKYYNELDQGLYECTAENNLRVSKIVYTLKDSKYANSKLMPIGYSNNYRGNKMNQISTIENVGLSNHVPTTTQFYRRRKFHKHKLNHHRHGQSNERTDSAELMNNNGNYLRNRQYKKFRFSKNYHNRPITTTPARQVGVHETTHSYNSPYIILLDDYADESKRLRNKLATTTSRNLLNGGDRVYLNIQTLLMPFIFYYWSHTNL